MQVLVDTSVWSLVLRRNPPARKVLADTGATAAQAAATLRDAAAAMALRDLVADGRAAMMGAIRQELLCGIKSARQFSQLRYALQGFVDIALTSTDYELAAEFFNLCRSQGVQGSNTDFLICAVASGRKLPILSTDLDFALYQIHLPIQLWTPAVASMPTP